MWILDARSRLVIAIVLGSFAAGGGIALAGHLAGCGKEPVADWTYHYGQEENQNHCAGGDGKDNLYGYGQPDELHGGLDRDVLRGATGDDKLWDQPGSDAGDYDGVCLGDGADYSNVLDMDGKDEVWDIPFPDGHADNTDDKNQFDQVFQANHGCPYAD